MKYRVYIDECGEHNLDRVDPSQPIFSLGGVILNQEEYSLKMKQMVEIKAKYFADDRVILRSYDIRKWNKEFSILSDPKKREEFYSDVRPFLESGYKFICISVDKIKYKEKYEDKAINPYEICIGIFLERLGYFLKREKIQSIEVIAEARGKKEDNELIEAFNKMMSGEYKELYQTDFSSFDVALSVVEKKENLVGHQLADLVTYPFTLAHKGVSNPTYDIVKGNLLYGSEINFKKLP